MRHTFQFSKQDSGTSLKKEAKLLTEFFFLLLLTLYYFLRNGKPRYVEFIKFQKCYKCLDLLQNNVLTKNCYLYTCKV